MPPKLNRRRTQAVLSKIDEILAWEARHENSTIPDLWNWASMPKYTPAMLAAGEAEVVR